MKKPFPPSSTWAKLSRAYRHSRNSESYNRSMDSKKSLVDSQDGENGAAQPNEGSGIATSDSTLDAVTAERDRLLMERADLQDRLLRRQAEFDNFRRRAEREKADVVDYANTQTVQALLPILDDFERALKVESADTEYARGMELIYQRLTDSLKKLGLEPITSTGKPFDPNLHHAVDSAETDEVEDHTILQEYQPGYNFRGKLLRPAMVKVAVKKT